MDTKSLHTLEYNKVLNILAGYTSFSAGTDLALNLHPTTDQIEAELWQAETREAVLLLDTHTNITIGGARDVRRAVDNAERGFTLPAEDVLQVRDTIVAARNLRRQLIKAEDDFPHLAAVAELIEECRGIVSSISRTIDERGEVLDSASTKLAKIRQDQRVVYGRIQDKLQKLLNSSASAHLQEPIITQRNGRYVVPLRAEAKGHIKGIVHDHSGSGATLWIEPMATVDHNNEYRSLQIKEQDEIERILAELSGKIAEQGDAIKRVVERMAELDLIFARARYASMINGVEPMFLEWREFEQPQPPKHANERAKWTPPPPNLHPGSSIWIKGARHPLLEPETVVPTDLTLDEDIFTVLITGPNTGGKTVSLKTMGLMVLMAQSGMHLPAVEAKLTLFDNVLADIGDEQSIEQSLSTFSAHITNIIRILKIIDDRSLVLFDELGSGTDPTEGAALAQSIVNFMRDKGATTFVATHYPELKLYASQAKGAVNASLLFDVDTLSPTYEMSIGIPGRSNAFAIAGRLGLDTSILDDALRLVGEGSHEAENLLDSIYELREKILAEEAGQRLAMRQAEEERDALTRRLEQIEEERDRVLAEARIQAQSEIADVQEELKSVRRKIRDADSLNKLKKLGKQAEQIEADMLNKNAPIIEKVKKPVVKRPSLQVGDTVLITSLNTKGEVISVSKKDAMVAVGRLQMRAKLADLEFKSRPEPEVEPESVVQSSKQSPGMEIDIRGKRVEEGLSTLEGYIDSAFLARLPWVRIIHGKGTGRLRNAVRKALKQNKQVASWEEGKDGEGGAGVTVAKLVEHK
jgi:DNA mismatch repair protein MutS2